MSITKNNLVDYISQYGPSFKNDAKYDETIKKTLRKLSVKPFEIETEYSRKLRKIFFDSDVENIKSVILTGTAGDGKTYLSHKIFDECCERGFVVQHNAKWNEEIIHLDGKSKDDKPYTLCFIKDLSELNKKNKEEVFNGFIRSLADSTESPTRDNRTFYVICANDGKLVNTLSVLQNDTNASICEEIERMLVEEEQHSSRINLSMFNLSRLDSAEHWKKIAYAVTMHEDWQKCNDCQHVKNCPIQINRKRLLSKKAIDEINSVADNSENLADDLSSIPEYAKGVFVERVYDILSASNKNGKHIPIRHLFALVSNILLGTSLFKYSNPLQVSIDCESIYSFFDIYKKVFASSKKGNDRQRLKFSQPFLYDFCSPYDNAVGKNLDNEKDKEEFLAFPLLLSFGLGQKSTEIIDRFLIYGSEDGNDQTYKTLMTQDEFFGDIEVGQKNQYIQQLKIKGQIYKGTVFHMAKRSYIDPDMIETYKSYDFIEQLFSQRRRLFFSMPDSQEFSFSPWNLTWYPATKKYLRFIELLPEDPFTEMRESEIEPYKKEIYRAFNRIFTGLFVTESSDEIYIPELSEYNKKSIYLKTKQSKIPSNYQRKRLELTMSKSLNHKIPILQIFFTFGPTAI